MAQKKAAAPKATTSKPKRKAAAKRKAPATRKAEPKKAKGIQPGETLTLKSGRTITKTA